jgi:hypothetical protein
MGGSTPSLLILLPVAQKGKQMFSLAKRAWREILFTLHKIKWFYQRGKRGWSNWDASEICSYVPKILGEMTLYYSTIADGIPYPFCEDSYQGPSWEETCKEIGEKLIRATEYINGNIPEEWNNWTEYERTLWIKDENFNVKEAMSLFCKYFRRMWN